MREPIPEQVVETPPRRGGLGRTSAASPRRVGLKRKALEDHRALVGDQLVAEVRELGRSLRGRRVLDLSVTATGGRVAGLLSSLGAPAVRVHGRRG